MPIPRPAGCYGQFGKITRIPDFPDVDQRGAEYLYISQKDSAYLYLGSFFALGAETFGILDISPTVIGAPTLLYKAMRRFPTLAYRVKIHLRGEYSAPGGDGGDKR